MGLGSLRCPTRLVASCRARTRTCGARTLCEAYAEHRRWTLGIRELPRPLVGVCAATRCVRTRKTGSTRWCVFDEKAGLHRWF